MADAQLMEHEDDTVSIPGYINVGGGLWCCMHLFRVDTNSAGTHNTCKSRQRSMAWKDNMRKVVLRSTTEYVITPYLVVGSTETLPELLPAIVGNDIKLFCVR